MSIYVGGKKAKLYRGDYCPAQFYKGDVKIAGYTNVEKVGTSISGVDTYNDALNLGIEGKSEQTVTANSPSPDYPEPIRSSENFDVVSCGRNLMGQERWYKYLRSINSADVTIKSDLSHANYISMYCPAYASVSRFMRGEFLDRTQYTFSYWYKLETPLQEGISYHTGIRIQYTDGTNSYGLVDYGHKTTQWVYVTLVSNAGKTIDYLFFLNSMSYSPWSGFADFQIEEGTTSTPYNPYHATTAHITDPLRSVGDVSDSIEVSDGKVKVIRRCGVKAFDGSEAWAPNDATSGMFYCAGWVGANSIVNTPMLCTHLKYKLKWPETAGYFGNPTRSLFFNLGSSVIAYNLPAFRDFLWGQKTSGTPITVLYQLATPIRTDITATPLGQALLALRTYPHYTQVYTNATLPPTLRARIKEISQ